MLDPDVALSYLSFVEERHRIWERRRFGEPGPWTSDPILATRKFTNVFRLLDFGSQFLLTDLLEPGLSPREVLFRCFLYRHTGRVEAWQYAELSLGHYPLPEDLDELLAAWKEYRGETTWVTKSARTPESIRTTGGQGWAAAERPLFTSAYLVFPQSKEPGTDKVESIVELARHLFIDQDITNDFLAASSQAERFAVLRRNKGVGDFMSMQVLTDYGYTTEDREDDFVVCGPGARRGAQLLDPRAKPEDTLRWAVDAIRSSPGCPMLGSRQPSYMDAQNTFCEFQKYVRFQSKPVVTKPYQPAHPGLQPAPVLPKHWSTTQEDSHASQLHR